MSYAMVNAALTNTNAVKNTTISSVEFIYKSVCFSPENSIMPHKTLHGQALRAFFPLHLPSSFLSTPIFLPLLRAKNSLRCRALQRYVNK